MNEVDLAVELSTTPMTIHMVRERKANMRKFTAQIEAAVEKLRENEKETWR